MPEWGQLFLQLGFPTASIILIVWKGIPWFKALNDEHKAEMKSLMEAHFTKIEEKDKDLREIHQYSMKIIEANTRSINEMTNKLSDFKSINTTLIETNLKLKHTNEVQEQIISILNKMPDAS